MKKSILFGCIVLFFTMANIIYMHLEIFDLSLITYRFNVKSHLFVVFDVLILYSSFLLFFKKGMKLLIIPFTISTIYILINVGYSRYFETYLPLSLYFEYNNLNGLSSNVYDAFEWTDIFFLISTTIVTACYIRFVKACQCYYKANFYVFFIGIAFMGITIIPVYNKYKKENLRLKEHFSELNDDRTILTTFFDDIKSDWSHSNKNAFFNFGLFVNLFMDCIEANNEKNFDAQIQELSPYLYSSDYISIDSSNCNKIVLLIMESFSSFPIDLVIGGKEITPNINSLKNNSYYNPNMSSETKLGESSDGQYTYMTGLLPLKNKVTINEIADINQIPSLPLLLKKKNPKWHVHMIIPTDENSWSQKSMCQRYGVDTLFTRDNYKGEKGNWLTDKQLFELSADIDGTLLKEKEFSMSIILTSSTHSPYNNSIENYDFNFPDTYSPELQNYLSNVHYADKYLGEYIQKLKDMDLFDKCMIVIVSDHKPNTPKLNIKEPTLCAKLPLIIINSPVKLEHEKRPIFQTTLFPTMLDLCSVENNWRGVGHSILMPDSVLESPIEIERKRREQDISEVLLYSKYNVIK